MFLVFVSHLVVPSARDCSVSIAMVHTYKHVSYLASGCTAESDVAGPVLVLSHGRGHLPTSSAK
jgi:hypothetical protein